MGSLVLTPEFADLHGGNLMIGLTDNRQLSVFEQQERRQPSYRQRNKDTGAYTYASRPCGKPMAGPIVLADLGCSLIGRGPHTRCGMSLSLHSPEILLDRGFSFEHDIWTVGLTVSIPQIDQPMRDVADFGLSYVGLVPSDERRLPHRPAAGPNGRTTASAGGIRAGASADISSGTLAASWQQIL